jgi:hypothetical protein
MAVINTGTQRQYQISTRLAAFARLAVSVTRLTVSGTQSRAAVDARASALATRKGHGRDQHDHDVEYPPGDLLVVAEQTARGTRFRH